MSGECDKCGEHALECNCEVIDLKQWNEYVADEVLPIPEGVELEMMSITTANSYKEKQTDFVPTGLKADPDSVRSRLFWKKTK